MTPEQRRQAILELARQDAELRVDAVAERFGVSRETIRRDLARLDARDLLRRVHGGAGPARLGIEAPFNQRRVEHAAAKAHIARAAAALFAPGDTLMIDTGSTTEAFAAALAERGAFNVVTNAVGVALALGGGAATSRVHLAGGTFRPEIGGTAGAATVDQLRRCRADHAVLTVGALDGVAGCADYDVEEAMVARAMIDRSRALTVLADASKFDRMAVHAVCDLSAVGRLVTDRPPARALADALRIAGVALVIAEPDPA